ncbi:MAG: glycosyl hydrolase 53 family protein [Eubacterium sp.]|nr:glycosyl hydrolase 53 family protein [Eubacterium sp.]
MIKYVKGMDLSTMEELEKLGAKYYDHGEEKDLLEIMKSYDIDMIRLRIWNDPYSLKGEPYGAGTNDLETTLRMGKKITEAGMGILLNFHYSDFWVDPGKQYKPKAWENYTVQELEEAVYDYTFTTIKYLQDNGVKISMVQIGNEITNGLLWPEGQLPNYENVARFVSSGLRAAKAADKSIPLMIHLDNGGNNELYRRWFDNYIEQGGEDFDIIGMSYYPFWHGTLEQLSYNMKDVAERYGKEIIIAEVSMGYTMEDYKEYEKLSDKERKGYATKPELVEKIDYPMTVEGQKDFMADLLRRIEAIPNGLGKGFFWWEPAWIPVPGSGWATPVSLEYIHDKGPCGNEWANQALFDYDGNALPTLEVIRDYQRK